MKKIFLVLLWLAIASAAKSQTLIQPVNLDFEYSQSGQTPFGWKLNKRFQAIGYQALATDTNALEGNYSLKIFNRYKSKNEINLQGDNELLGVVYQEIEADNFLGMELIFGAKYRIENPSKDNYAILLVQQESDVQGSSSVVMSDTLRSATNSNGSLKVLIDPNTKVIKYGFAVYGLTTAYFDDVYIDIVYDFTKNTPKINITQDIKHSIANFAKLISWLKFFNPNPNFEKTRWDQLEYYFVKKAVEFNNLEDFTQFLLNEFKNVISPEPSRLNKDTIKSAIARVITGMPTTTNTHFVSQKNIDVFVTNKNNPGTLLQFINIAKEKPTSMELTYYYKFKKYSYNGRGSVWVRIDDVFGASLEEFKSNYIDKNTAEWQKETINLKIPEDAGNIRIGLVLEGNGEVIFDNITLKLKISGKDSIFSLRNGNFEEDAIRNTIPGWSLPKYSEAEGYNAKIIEGGYNSKKAVKLYSDTSDLYKLPQLLGKYQDTLLPFTIVNYPVMLHPEQIKNSKLPYFDFPKSFRINENDVYSRFVVLVDLYAYIRNFSLNYVDTKSLDQKFFDILDKANNSENTIQFSEVLNDFYSIANDDNARFWNGMDYSNYLPNIGIFVQDAKLFIYGANKYNIPDGSEIVAIQNSPFSLISKEIKKNKSQFTQKILQILRGTKNSSLIIEYQEPKGTKSAAKLVRNSIKLKSFDKPFFASELDSGIIYLDATSLSDEDFKMISPQLFADDIKGIIFDLRGYSTLSEHILGFFTQNPIIGYEAQINIYTAPAHSIITPKIVTSKIQSNGRLANKKIIFLINEQTSSYSEIIAYLAKASKIGILIGESTQGKFSEVGQIKLSGYFFGTQSFIKLFSNNKLLSDPISPDILVEQTLEASIKNIDLQLNKAIELIKNENQ